MNTDEHGSLGEESEGASACSSHFKVAKEITNIHEAQLINYLRASGVGVGLILNFGEPRLGIKRRVV